MLERINAYVENQVYITFSKVIYYILSFILQANWKLLIQIQMLPFII